MIQLRPLSQMDAKWKDKKLGASDLTIGTCGCLLTCMTMVANAFGLDETPASLNDRLMGMGGFAGVGVRPQYLPKLIPGTGYARLPSFDPPAPLAAIDAQLAKGLPAVVKVDYFLEREGVQDHWIVLTGKQEEDYIVQDPYPIRNELDPVLLSASPYGKGLRPQDVIRDVILFSGPALSQAGGAPGEPQPATPRTPTPAPAPQPAAKKALPEGALVVYAAEDRLGLRREPVQSGDNLVRRLPRYARLTALEPPPLAREKIGKGETWLEVQTDDGAQGFVAAWYLSLTKETPQPGAQPSSGSPLVVHSTPGKLAFRRQPALDGANLIRYVPRETQFVVIEPAGAAVKKIGQNGQWLNVRSVEGESGYVAAWYVAAARPDPALGVRVTGESFAAPAFSPEPEAPAGPLVVRAAEDGLPLYDQPGDRSEVATKLLPLAAELLVLEPGDAAVQKLGVAGEWLRVRDLFGGEGYVEAGRVVKRAHPEEG